MKNALVTYIYPQAIKFFPDFINSIENQTVENFKILVFNDGVENAAVAFKSLNPRVEIINLDGSIAEIRFKSLDILRKSNYDKFIFQDIDDCMSNNRVEVTLKYLNKYSLVCNDLDLLNNGEIIKRNVWKKRLGQRFEFDHKFLIDKNIVGFGNTAVKRELLNFNIKKSSLPIAVDWFIFYQILYHYNKAVVFIGNCSTIYRQHQDNIAGLNKVLSADRLMKILKTKLSHYLALKEAGIFLKPEIENIENLKNKIILNNKPLHLESEKELFWWEETNNL